MYQWIPVGVKSITEETFHRGRDMTSRADSIQNAFPTDLPSKDCDRILSEEPECVPGPCQGHRLWVYANTASYRLVYWLINATSHAFCCIGFLEVSMPCWIKAVCKIINSDRTCTHFLLGCSFENVGLKCSCDCVFLFCSISHSHDVLGSLQLSS